MPSTLPVVSRRRMLIGAGRGIAAVALLGGTASACASSPTPPAVEDLKAQLELAERDSQTARDAAAAANPVAAPALAEVASERSEHARALAEEIARAAGEPVQTTTETATTTTSTSAQAGPPPSVRDVINALRESADSATALAAELSGYRAGLLGSIAASCTASYQVALVFREPAP